MLQLSLAYNSKGVGLLKKCLYVFDHFILLVMLTDKFYYMVIICLETYFYVNKDGDIEYDMHYLYFLYFEITNIFDARHPVVLCYLMVYFITTIHKWLKILYIDFGDTFRLLCNHHQAVLRHSQGTNVRTQWDPISFTTYVKIIYRLK
jgi:hypothetical protein